MRFIRSYVKREGRLTKGQQNALDNYWSIYGIETENGNIDLDHVFGRRAPTILDIGSGMGESLLNIATQHPENNYLSVEVHRPGVGSLLRNINLNGLMNIRVINQDIIEVLAREIPDNSFDMVFIFFPDPWPKKKHHKRRLINAGFVNLLHTKLKNHCRIYIATDWEDYATQIHHVFSGDDKYINLSPTNRYAIHPEWRLTTKYELRGKRLGNPIFSFLYGVHP